MRPEVKIDRRQQDRVQGVLPVRVRGTDSSGAPFEELAHTLDLTASGARLGAIRHELKALDTLVVLFRQRRVEFSVVWTRRLEAQGEYQVGLQMMAQEHGNDPWGLSLAQSNTQHFTKATAVSGAA
jgi:PilZ domain